MASINIILTCALSPLVLGLLGWFVIHLFPVRLTWAGTCVKLGMSTSLLSAISVKVDMFLRTALSGVNVDGVWSLAIWPEIVRNPPPKSWGAGVSSGGVAVGASGTAGGVAAGVLDRTPAEASGRALSSELHSSGSFVLPCSWGSAVDLRDDELSPPSLGEGMVVDVTIRNLSIENNDTISNTEVIDDGDVVTVEGSVNNAVESNKNNSDKNSNNSNKNGNVNNSNNAELSNEPSTGHDNNQSQSHDSSSSDPSQSVLLEDAEMVEASGARKRGISSVDISSDGVPAPVLASRKGSKKRVSVKASFLKSLGALSMPACLLQPLLFLRVSVLKCLLPLKLLNGSDHCLH